MNNNRMSFSKYERAKEIKDLLYSINEESELVKAIMKKQNEYNLEVLKNRRIYEENIKYYKEFIEIIANIIRKIALKNNSISYSYVILKLLYDGYLSNNFLYTKQGNKEDLFDIIGFLGIDIINGVGCCRHISAIHKDIFNILEISDDIFPCIAVKDSIAIERVQANHHANLFKYNDLYYLHDIYNQQFFSFSDSLLLEIEPKEKTSIYDTVLFYEPVLDIIMNNILFLQIKEKIEIFGNDSRKIHISSKELDEIINYTNIQYDNSKIILEKLKKENIVYTKKIIPKKKSC